MRPRSCHVVCFSTDLYIICGLLLLYTINIVWYSDVLCHTLSFHYSGFFTLVVFSNLVNTMANIYMNLPVNSNSHGGTAEM